MNNTNLNHSQTLDGILKMVKKSIFIELNVCLPATVVSYNSADNTVDLQPAIQAVLKDNSFVSLPQIFDVPVLELGGAGLSIKIPLQAGDTGIVIFCDRDISLFKQEKKNTQPNTLRKHDLSDGIFIPMRFGNSGSSNIMIQSEDGNTQFEVTSSGINIKGNINIEGNITSSGNIDTSGTISATGKISSDEEVTAKTINLTTHIHTGGHNGGNTGTPVA